MTSPTIIKPDSLFRRLMRLASRIGMAVLFSFLLAGLVQAQEVAVPVNIQVPLLLKILTFDRSLDMTDGHELVIGVAYQGRFRSSLDTKDEFLKAVAGISSLKSGYCPLRCVPIDMDREDALACRIVLEHIRVMYVASLRSISLDDIVSATRASHVVSITGVPEYTDDGVAVGIGTKGEKPLILINRNAAKLEGSDFSSQLLNLAKIIE